MSLANYIKMAAARVEYVLAAAAPLPESERFPCSACLGDGFLGTKTEFVRLRHGREVLKDRKDESIVSVGAIPCPACSGTGIDFNKFHGELKTG